MSIDSVELIDFNNSFITCLTKDNSYGRFNIEAICEVEETLTGNIDTYYLLSTVMACDVYGNGNLFHQPPYSFTAIFSEKEFRRIRIYAIQNKINDDIKNSNDCFEEVRFDITKKSYKIVKSNAKIIEKALNNNRLFASIETLNESNTTKIKAIFPVKHINVKNNTKEIFQIETGPIIFFDQLNVSVFSLCDVKLAYVAFRNLTNCELLFNEKISIKANENSHKFIHFFSKRLNFESRIQIYS